MLTLCLFPIITPRPSLQSYTCTMHAGRGGVIYGTRQKKVSGLSVSTSKVRTVLPTVPTHGTYLAARAQFFGPSMVRVKKSL